MIFFFFIIALSETWLTEASKDIFKIPKYNAFHYVRENRSGGGVSLFIYEAYKSKVREDFSLKLDGAEVESVFIEPSGVSGGKNIIVGVIYRPPDSVVKYFNESLLDLINKQTDTPPPYS